jgi:hypothetical protein
MTQARELGPTWIVDPALPGVDVPPQGGSLLDVLTLDERGRREVPFPFERLVRRIEAAAGCKANDECTRAVLIPLGRSLQRVAASPDFFANPRVVLAVTESRRGGLPLRDRLFLGYQQAQGLIEVISYNDAAGRFEFQLIKNYRAGEHPQVYQARRAVCVSCHQNHAPIFSRPLWSETNANPLVARRLQGHAFNGVGVAATTDTPNAIDAATDRANALSTTQALWRTGCGTAAAGERCRMAALRAALQFALASERGFAQDRAHIQEALATSATSLWPSGIAHPNPDLLNRDPFAYPNAARGAEITHVPAALEPLALRAPLATIAPEELADVLIRGLVAMWPSDRIGALDAALSRHRAARREITLRCRLAGARGRTFECNGGSADSADRLSGSFDGTSVTLTELQVGAEVSLRNAASKIIQRSASELVLAPLDRGRSARLASGNAIERVRLRWSASEAVASISIRADFMEVFASPPQWLTGAAIPELIDAAIAHAKGQAFTACCATAGASAMTEPMPQARLTGIAAAFEPHCGACHRTPESTPPSFLSGDQLQVERQLDSCAPRIFVRLAMAGLAPKDRDKTPMPPGIASSDGRTMQALVALRAQLEPSIKRRYGRIPALEELLASGYERLPACLPPSMTH